MTDKDHKHIVVGDTVKKWGEGSPTVKPLSAPPEPQLRGTLHAPSAPTITQTGPFAGFEVYSSFQELPAPPSPDWQSNKGAASSVPDVRTGNKNGREPK